MWEPTSQGPPHLHTQIQTVPVLSSLYPSLISIFIFYLHRCTLPDFPSVFSLASLPFLPVVIEQKHYQNSEVYVKNACMSLAIDNVKHHPMNFTSNDFFYNGQWGFQKLKQSWVKQSWNVLQMDSKLSERRLYGRSYSSVIPIRNTNIFVLYIYL